MISKSQRLTELEREVEDLQETVDRLDGYIAELQLSRVAPLVKTSQAQFTHPGFPKATVHDHCLSFCLDLWPLSDWKRLSWSRSKDNYTQLVVGPFRMDWFVG